MKRTFRCLVISAAVLLLFSLTVGADPVASPAVTAESTTVFAGDTIRIVLSVSENTGISALRLSFTYDHDVLSLTSAEDKGILGSHVFSADLSENPFILAWNFPEPAEEAFSENGVIAVLTFLVNADAAPGNYEISLSCETGDALDAEHSEFKPVLNHGTITIKERAENCRHPQTDWRIAKEPTCAEEGIRENFCTDCGEVLGSEPLAKTNHKFTEKVVAPTCKDGGYTLHSCTVCSYSFKDHETAKTSIHTVKEWKTVTQPTKTHGGLKTGICVVCGQSISQTIPRLSSVSNPESSQPAASSELSSVSSQTVSGELPGNNSAPGNNSQDPSHPSKGFPTALIIVIAVIFAAAGGAAVWYFVIRRRKAG